MKARLAVIDDESRMVGILEMVLAREGYEVQGFTDSSEAWSVLQEEPFDLVLTDLKMPGLDGLSLLRRLHEREPDLPVILMTAFASVSTAVSALREGAFDYVQKPFDNGELKSLIAKALKLRRLTRENQYLRAKNPEEPLPGGLVAKSPAMLRILEMTRRVARSKSTVLISGESGTGKELIARNVHYHSPRVSAPFLALNCKALAENLLESELFGHEKGAFTGATRSRPGLFERADGGSLFLDEIGEISLDFQAKLLRVLQERRVRRVGGEQEREVDVRILAATNRDLRAQVEIGEFREDLYFRLAVIPVYLPPLRERPEDILPLAQHFLRRWSQDLGIEGWTPEAERWMLSHSWPGNVRELENALERGAVLARGTLLELEDLRLESSPARVNSQGTQPDELQEFLDQQTRTHVSRILEEEQGVRIQAARRLGIDRTTLYRLMQRLGLT